MLQDEYRCVEFVLCVNLGKASDEVYGRSVTEDRQVSHDI